MTASETSVSGSVQRRRASLWETQKALLKCVIMPVSAFLSGVGDIKDEIKKHKILECGK